MSDEITLVSVALKVDDRAKLDAFRRQHENPPTRPAAVRTLLREALARREIGQGEVRA